MSEEPLYHETKRRDLKFSFGTVRVVCGLELRAWGLGFQVSGLWCRVECAGFGVSDFGFRISGPSLGCRGSG